MYKVKDRGSVYIIRNLTVYPHLDHPQHIFLIGSKISRGPDLQFSFL